MELEYTVYSIGVDPTKDEKDNIVNKSQLLVVMTKDHLLWLIDNAYKSIAGESFDPDVFKALENARKELNDLEREEDTNI